MSHLTTQTAGSFLFQFFLLTFLFDYIFFNLYFFVASSVIVAMNGCVRHISSERCFFQITFINQELEFFTIFIWMKKSKEV